MQLWHIWSRTWQQLVRLTEIAVMYSELTLSFCYILTHNHHDNTFVAHNDQCVFFSNVNIVDEAFLRKLFSLFCFSCQSIVMPPPTPSLLCLYSGECEGGAETECRAERSSGSHRGADCLPRWPVCDWPGGSGTAYQRQCSKWHQWAEYLYVRGDGGVPTFYSHM